MVCCFLEKLQKLSCTKWQEIYKVYPVPLILTFATLLANAADDKMVIFFLFFSENKIWHFIQIVSIGDNLHEMSKPVFWEK